MKKGDESSTFACNQIICTLFLKKKTNICPSLDFKLQLGRVGYRLELLLIYMKSFVLKKKKKGVSKHAQYSCEEASKNILI